MAASGKVDDGGNGRRAGCHIYGLMSLRGTDVLTLVSGKVDDEGDGKGAGCHIWTDVLTRQCCVSLDGDNCHILLGNNDMD